MPFRILPFVTCILVGVAFSYGQKLANPQPSPFVRNYNDYNNQQPWIPIVGPGPPRPGRAVAYPPKEKTFSIPKTSSQRVPVNDIIYGTANHYNPPAEPVTKSPRKKLRHNGGKKRRPRGPKQMAHASHHEEIHVPHLNGFVPIMDPHKHRPHPGPFNSDPAIPITAGPFDGDMGYVPVRASITVVDPDNHPGSHFL